MSVDPESGRGFRKYDPNRPAGCMVLWNGIQGHLLQTETLIDDTYGEVADYILTEDPSVSGASELIQRMERLLDKMRKACGLQVSGENEPIHSGPSDDFESFPLSSGDHPMNQIVNRRGIVNINYNYNIYRESTNSGGVKEHGVDFAQNVANAGEELFPPSAPTRTYPGRPVPSPSLSATQDLANLNGTEVKNSARVPSSKDNSHITRSWAFSDVEKAQLKDSIVLMFLGSLSRRTLARELENLAESIKTERWDEKKQCYVPIELGPDSEGARSDGGLSGGLVSPIPLPSECTNTIVFPTGVPGVGNDAKPNHLKETSADRGDSGEGGGNSRDIQSMDPAVPSSSDMAFSSSSPAKGFYGRAFNSQNYERAEKLNISSRPFPCHEGPLRTTIVPTSLPETGNISTTGVAGLRSASGDMKKCRGMPLLGPVLREHIVVDDEIYKGVTFELPKVDENGEEKPEDAPIPSWNPSSKGVQSREDGPEHTSHDSRKKQLLPRLTAHPEIPKLCHINDSEAPCRSPSLNHPSMASRRSLWSRAGGDDAGMTYGPIQADEKPHNKNNTSEAEQYGRNTDTPGDARPATVLSMPDPTGRSPDLTRTQKEDRIDLSYLALSSSEVRKCRLCRNMFTDGSNVPQADGRAPCSFHPDMFLCCGGPPVMISRGLVAMNLVSPGCTKCYHQDKARAWNLETLRMKDPVLF